MKIKGRYAQCVMPTLFQAGNKFYIIRKVAGRKRQLYLRGINTVESAKHMVTECDIACVHQAYEEFAAKFQPQRSVTLAAAAELWVKQSKEVSDNRDKVVRAKQRLMFSFCDFLGHKHLSAVQQADVERFIALRNEQVRPTTVKDELVKLRTFFRFCIKQKLVSSNPAEHVVGPKGSQRTQDYVHVVMRSDIEQLNLRPVYRNIVYALWLTGLRIEELYRVRLQDIHESILHVRCDEERTKNAKGREVDICSEAREALRKVALSQLPHPETVRKQLRKACKAVNVEKITPHQLRHSRASIWYAQGLPKKNISCLLGHSSSDITERYLHPIRREELKNVAIRRNQ